MDILIYLDQQNTRTTYIFNHIFNHILGLNIEFTSDSIFFTNSQLPKINYSKKAFSDELFFYSSSLLFEDDISPQNLTISLYRQVQILFLCNKSVLPFDPFAASFYMLTRYEEYLPHKKDKIGRFSFDQSVAYKNNFLTTPVVDKWILFIKEKLLDKFPKIIFKKQKFNFINTVDIDNAYSYLEKGFFRTLGSTIKDILCLNSQNIIERFKVIFLNKKDPYDTYDELLRIHKSYGLNTIFFFLLGDYDKYDKNIHYLNQKLREKIKFISEYCDVGIHLSFSSINNNSSIFVEIDRLRKILNTEITKNRQHYLYLNIPHNYRNLIQAGIKSDYSMGYPAHPGFRAGTSYNFYFYDLEKNISTNLLLYPLSVMDVSLNSYLKLNPEKSNELIQQIINNIKSVNGTFMSLWHNESLNYNNKWKGWDSVYENMIRYIYDE
ncbi:MAG: hypothetical protein CMP49_05955 [Flavobacteriales bacterium]|nr:hypothetical protein [Flavobacteriales bacterium]|tara:strand:- start:3250 stop:4557 length:1308 start_codon:yes stop_codon:yes gene_type:complete